MRVASATAVSDARLAAPRQRRDAKPGDEGFDSKCDEWRGASCPPAGVVRMMAAAQRGDAATVARWLLDTTINDETMAQAHHAVRLARIGGHPAISAILLDLGDGFEEDGLGTASEGSEAPHPDDDVDERRR